MPVYRQQVMSHSWAMVPAAHMTQPLLHRARQKAAMSAKIYQTTTCCLWLQGDIIGVGVRTTGEVTASVPDDDVCGRGVHHVFKTGEKDGTQGLNARLPSDAGL